MKCKSCNDEVNTKFKHALSINSCPLCGGEIMSVQLHSILNELKTTMERSSEYIEEISDWLYTNYNLKRIKENEVIVDKKQLEEQKNNFKNIETIQSKNIIPNNEEQVEEPIEPTIFQKRAGVKITHKRAIDFIKGKEQVGVADPSEFEEEINDEYNDAVEGFESTNEPLNKTEQNQINNLFSKKDNYLEINKLKQLQAQQSVNGEGRGSFRRSS